MKISHETSFFCDKKRTFVDIFIDFWGHLSGGPKRLFPDFRVNLGFRSSIAPKCGENCPSFRVEEESVESCHVSGCHVFFGPDFGLLKSFGSYSVFLGVCREEKSAHHHRRNPLFFSGSRTLGPPWCIPFLDLRCFVFSRRWYGP